MYIILIDTRPLFENSNALSAPSPTPATTPTPTPTPIQTVHEKRRDHVCGYCKGVAFGRASTLKKHIDVVHLKIMRSRGAK